jgi:hypothetical protein
MTNTLGVINVRDYGAVGDGKHDDTQAFMQAMEACNYRKMLYIPAGDYVIKDTIVCKATRISGEAMHNDSGTQGTNLVWRPSVVTDLKPCILIEEGDRIVIEHFAISGNENYARNRLEDYISKEGFDAQDYSMFVAGTCGIKVSKKSDPIFRKIKTDRVKAGMVWDNESGHISAHECTLGGLIGLFIAHNTSDFYFSDSTINGVFTCILLGKSGCNLQMVRVHLGFAPYGIFQVEYPRGRRNGLYSCQFENVRWERIGECCIKLLPDVLTWETTITGFGMTWTLADYSKAGQGWQSYCMPPSLVPDPQRYALDLGVVENCRFLTHTYGGALPSPNNPNARIARIQRLKGINDLTGLRGSSGLSSSDMVEIVKQEDDAFHLSTTSLLYDEVQSWYQQPVAAGQLLNTDQRKWTVSDGVLEVADSYPDELSEDIFKYYGDYAANPVVFRISPAGAKEPQISIPFLGNDRPDANRFKRAVNVRAFVLSPSGAQARYTVRLQDKDKKVRYVYGTYSRKEQRTWQQIRLQYSKPDPEWDASYTHLIIRFFSTTEPFYFLMPMASEDVLRPFSPYKHPNVRDDFEIAAPDKGLILRSPDGTRWRITINNQGYMTVKKL